MRRHGELTVTLCGGNRGRICRHCGRVIGRWRCKARTCPSYARTWALAWLSMFIALTAVRIYIQLHHPRTWIGYLMPLTYFVPVTRGVFLKAEEWAGLWPNVLILAVYGIGVLVLAATRFQKRLA